jgi:hypothetical protein
MNTTIETQLEFNFVNAGQFKFDFDDNIYFGTPNSSQLITIMPTNKILFRGVSGSVGTLDWSDGIMRFEGDVDESAQLFFDNIVTRYIQTQLPLS